MKSAETKHGLQVTTPTDREIVMTRALHAPRDLVFRAFTEPKLISRWLLGPGGWSMPICEVDLRVGGAFRYRWRNDENGQVPNGDLHAKPSAVGRVAAAAGCAKLVLSHVMPELEDEMNAAVAAVRASYGGEIVLAHDLATIEVV